MIYPIIMMERRTSTKIILLTLIAELFDTTNKNNYDNNVKVKSFLKFEGSQCLPFILSIFPSLFL